MHQTLFLNKALNQFETKAHACIVIESEEIQQAWDFHWIVHDPKTNHSTYKYCWKCWGKNSASAQNMAETLFCHLLASIDGCPV